MECVHKVLQEARIEEDRIDDIILAGGSSRIPEIQKRLSQHFRGKKCRNAQYADETATHGAGKCIH